MTEWGVFLVAVSLLSAAFMVARPVAALTRTNTRLECTAERLSRAIDRLEERSAGLEKELRAHAGLLARHGAEIDGIKRKGKGKAV